MRTTVIGILQGLGVDDERPAYTANQTIDVGRWLPSAWFKNIPAEWLQLGYFKTGSWKFVKWGIGNLYPLGKYITSTGMDMGVVDSFIIFQRELAASVARANGMINEQTLSWTPEWTDSAKRTKVISATTKPIIAAIYSEFYGTDDSKKGSGIIVLAAVATGAMMFLG